MNSNGFKETGNKIPIPIDEFTNHVKSELLKYDKLKNATETNPSYNPYLEPIIYTTSQGKLVQVPEEIKKNAIDDWLKNGEGNNMEKQEMPGMDYDNNYNTLGHDQQLNLDNEMNSATVRPFSTLGQMKDNMNDQMNDYTMANNILNNPNVNSCSGGVCSIKKKPSPNKNIQDQPNQQVQQMNNTQYLQKPKNIVERIIIVKEKSNYIYFTIFFFILVLISFYLYKQKKI